MSERIEPELQHDPAELRAEPRTPPAPAGTTRRRSFWLLWLLLLAVVLPVLPVVLMRWLPPPTTAFMLQSEKKPVRYEWVPASKIADAARKAVVAAEDQKFWTHQGFDIEAIEKAFEHNKRSKRRRGASTITQQTAKNLFLWSGGGYARKGVEAVYTVLLEKLWNKDRILEVYLNVAEFGPGIYGVEAASRTYFNKPASQLTPNEAARLAAILPSPRRWSVLNPGTYVQKRVNWVMRQMGYGPRPAEDDEPEPPEALMPLEEDATEVPAAPPASSPETDAGDSAVPASGAESNEPVSEPSTAAEEPIADTPENSASPAAPAQ